jgi:hypothetical protein
MMGSEILRASGLTQTPYYQLIAKAERVLDQNPGDARREDVLQGIYSLGRLHLKAGLSADMNQMKKQAGNGVAAARGQ